MAALIVPPFTFTGSDMACSVAIVLGGAWDWQDDLRAALTLEAKFEFYAVNDQITYFPGDIVACTLHSERIWEWVDRRAEQQLSAPREVWTRHMNGTVETVQASRPSTEIKTLQEWGGTSGLFAFQVARQHGHKHIIFCGVPIDEGPNAFHDIGCAIAKYTRHRDVWKRNMPAIAPFARSMSGWTSEKLGIPTLEWLHGAYNGETVTDPV